MVNNYRVRGHTCVFFEKFEIWNIMTSDSLQKNTSGTFNFYSEIGQILNSRIIHPW